MLLEESVMCEEAKERMLKILQYDSLDERKAKQYTRQELMNLLKKSLKTDNEESCKIMMKRGMFENNGLLQPRRDPRLKVRPSFGFTNNDTIHFAGQIKCNVLIIKSNETTYFEPKENFYAVLDVVRKNAGYMEYQKINGPHHLHMEKPQIVASIVMKFLENINAK